MMPAASKIKSVTRPFPKPGESPARAAKPDTRLLDAEQFLLPTYKRQPVVMTHGRGAYVYDASGKKYLDFLGGIAVNALGHAHPRIVKFIRLNDVADLESKFDDTVCAILLEAIQGEGGIYPVSEAFWNRARELATKHDALLIADEIQCGLGRTGRYFGCQKFSSKPDIVLVAKPLAAGLPLGAILTTEAVASRVSPGMHGTTFGGGPLACAVALEFLSVVEGQELLENVRV